MRCLFLYEGRFVYTEAEVPDGAHVYYTTTDGISVNRWCSEHQKFADVAKAWEEGKKIQFLNYGYWEDCTPTWDSLRKYRVKPAGLKWTDLKCGDVITDDLRVAMVTAISKNAKDAMHIYAGNHWLNDTDVETNWTRVER